MPNFQNIKILVIAAKNAYETGVITAEQYNVLLEDIKSDLFTQNKKTLEKEVDELISKYAKI